MAHPEAQTTPETGETSRLRDALGEASAEELTRRLQSTPQERVDRDLIPRLRALREAPPALPRPRLRVLT